MTRDSVEDLRVIARMLAREFRVRPALPGVMRPLMKHLTALCAAGALSRRSGWRSEGGVSPSALTTQQTIRVRPTSWT